MALEQRYTTCSCHVRPEEEAALSEFNRSTNRLSQGPLLAALPLLVGINPAIAAVDVTLPLPAALLAVGAAFLTGLAGGLTVEHFNLRLRERQLARGRRILAAQVRGLRQQLLAFYEQRDGTTAGNQPLPILPVVIDEEHQP